MFGDSVNIYSLQWLFKSKFTWALCYDLAAFCCPGIRIAILYVGLRSYQKVSPAILPNVVLWMQSQKNNLSQTLNCAAL